MSIQQVDYSFNPFALNTTAKAWEDPTSSQSTRICRAAVNIAYDIYVKNPYDLTIGNCKQLFEAKVPQPTITKIGICSTAVFGGLYTLMLYGATFHVLGTSLAVLGSKTGCATLSRAAEATKALGKNLFVSGAVPIYGVFYALPKQIALTLPPLAQAVAAKISIAANWTFQHVLTPLWTQVIYPAAQIAEKALTFAAAKIGAALQKISHAVVMAANEIMEKVIIPLWQNAILPALENIGHAAQFVMTKIGSALQVIEAKVIQSVRLVFQNVISPLWHKAILPGLKAFEGGIKFVAKEIGQALSTIASTVANTAQRVFLNFIVPAWNKLVSPVLTFAGKMLNEMALIVGESLQYLAEATTKAASFVFHRAIVPAFQLLNGLMLKAGNLLSKHVIKPLGVILGDVAVKAGQVFKVVFDSAFVPAIKVVTSSANALGGALIEFKQEVWQAINEAIVRSRAFFSFA